MISLLVAMDRNQVIGYQDDMPWHLPNDLKYFKEQTTGQTIIMGRKTFESIGRVLPHRKNIIVTQQQDYRMDGAEVVHSLDKIYHWNKTNPDEELFVIGGGHLFKQILPFADRMYITKIDETFPGDTYFPNFNEADWILTKEEKGVKDEKNAYDYFFLQYDRIKPSI